MALRYDTLYRSKLNASATLLCKLKVNLQVLSLFTKVACSERARQSVLFQQGRRGTDGAHTPRDDTRDGKTILGLSGTWHGGECISTPVTNPLKRLRRLIGNSEI